MSGGLSNNMVAGQRAQQKKLAAQAAVELVESGMTVGLGSGSTFAHALDCLAERYQGATLRDIHCVASSNQTAVRARALGIPLVPLSADLCVDISIDGADEIDPQGRLIKGGGGALLREKLIAEASARPIIIADESKCVEQLGAFPLPVEVLPFGWERCACFLSELGAEVVKRREYQARSPYLTDNGHYILDCAFGSIREPEQLAARIKAHTGIIEHGLFIGLVSEVILARASGIEIWNKGEEPVRSRKQKEMRA